jgi:hypothetical protein
MLTTAQRNNRLTDQRKHLIAYCMSKITVADWHAVQDAASDIREINAQLDLLREIDDDTD